MKPYEKPQCNQTLLAWEQPVASLSQWLSANGLEQAGITTYELAS